MTAIFVRPNTAFSVTELRQRRRRFHPVLANVSRGRLTMYMVQIGAKPLRMPTRFAPSSAPVAEPAWSRRTETYLGQRRGVTRRHEPISEFI